MKNYTFLKAGMILAVLAMIFGFGMGAVFGVNEDSIKSTIKENAVAVQAEVYNNDEAAMDKVTSKSWSYMKRAHLHAGVMGIGAVAMILLIGFIGSNKTELLVTSIALGGGALFYGLFWMLAGFKAPELGSTGLAKEFYNWVAMPSSGAYMLATLNVLRLAIIYKPNNPKTSVITPEKELANA